MIHTPSSLRERSSLTDFLRGSAKLGSIKGNTSRNERRRKKKTYAVHAPADRPASSYNDRHYLYHSKEQRQPFDFLTGLLFPACFLERRRWGFLPRYIRRTGLFRFRTDFTEFRSESCCFHSIADIRHRVCRQWSAGGSASII